MSRTGLVIIGLALALGCAWEQCGSTEAAEFSAEATALPFPPDAKEVEFAPRFGDIKYTSVSPLKSLAAFYLKEMPARGWQHDEPAAVVEDETIKLTFKHEAALVKVELKQWSKEVVHISLDCEKLQFTGTDDPVKLVAAGVPVPKAILKLQKDFPLPAGAVDLQYSGDGCMFKSPLKLDEAFDHFTKLAPGKGFRESRPPIVTATRKYTEFKSGTAEFSVNVFTDAVGSRIILELKDEAKETRVPPLAAVASLPIKRGGSDKPAAGGAATTSAAATPIDVTTNKGSAVVDYNGKKYTLANVACYRPKSRGSTPTLIFSAKPIPVNKLQALVATKDDVSFGDLYEFNWPEHLTIHLSDHPSFSFATSNASIGRPVENGTGKLAAAAGRVQGSLAIPTLTIFDTEKFSFTATADAVIITPSTRIVGPGDPILKSDNPILAEAPIPFPGEVQNAGSEGSKFRKKYTALVSTPQAEVAAFYGKELPAKGWTRTDVESAGNAMQFKNDKMELAISWKQERGKTAIEAIARNIALAKQEGVFPEPGKGRLVLGNASDVAVVFTIGTTNYPLKPGQGGKDQKDALNYSLAPGKYTVLLKVPGQPQETEKIEITAGTTWGLIALPGGGCFPVQLF